mmetsp:Transcript_30447/g.61187  ORF Transcript_30447/g.61187 Transcript_30447/m.61187 type:complete len:209 (-) Transcript_30447:19-645(-)
MRCESFCSLERGADILPMSSMSESSSSLTIPKASSSSSSTIGDFCRTGDFEGALASVLATVFAVAAAPVALLVVVLVAALGAAGTLGKGVAPVLLMPRSPPATLGVPPLAAAPRPKSPTSSVSSWASSSAPTAGGSSGIDGGSGIDLRGWTEGDSHPGCATAFSPAAQRKQESRSSSTKSVTLRSDISSIVLQRGQQSKCVRLSEGCP